MPHGFEAYRIFIAAPGDLEADRQACYDAVAAVNESHAMAAKVLLVSVGLRENSQIEANRSIVSDNVRWSTYFIQLFEDDWGPRSLFRKLFLLALECRDDAAMPMRDMVICLKDAPQEVDPEILGFRAELQARQDVQILRYRRMEDLREQLQKVCEGWADSIIGSMRENSAD